MDSRSFTYCLRKSKKIKFNRKQIHKYSFVQSLQVQKIFYEQNFVQYKTEQSLPSFIWIQNCIPQQGKCNCLNCMQNYDKIRMKLWSGTFTEQILHGKLHFFLQRILPISCKWFSVFDHVFHTNILCSVNKIGMRDLPYILNHSL